MSTTTWDGSEALSLHESGQSTQLIDGQVEGSEIRPLGWRGGRTASVSTEPNTRSDALSGFEMPPSAPASDVAGPEPEEAEAEPCFRITDAGVEWSPIEPGAPPDYAAPTHLLLRQHDQRLARWPEVKLARLAAGLEV
uniref:Uncharacterized protein n=1 Tax=Emiliania huxleyi TaxID=2903 RepID=A0A7S3TFW3_EMIHU